MKNKEKINEEMYKSFDRLDLSKIPGSATQILTANFDRFNACKTYEDVVALCHELLDGKLDTQWSAKFFYQLDQIKQNNPNPRRAYEQAMLYVNNARMKGMGLGMDRGGSRRRFYEGEQQKVALPKDKCYVVTFNWQDDRESFNDSWATVDFNKAQQIVGTVVNKWFDTIDDYANSSEQMKVAGKSYESWEKKKDMYKAAAIKRLIDAVNGGKGRLEIEWNLDIDDGLDTPTTHIAIAIEPIAEYEDEINSTNDIADFDEEIILLESMDDSQKEEFKKKLREGKVEFKYKKKDGTERKAVGTMKPELMDLPKKKTQSDVDGAEKKKALKLPEDSVFYYDLESKGFRSFKMENFIGYV